MGDSMARIHEVYDIIAGNISSRISKHINRNVEHHKNISSEIGEVLQSATS
jgi:hypothetical protein